MENLPIVVLRKIFGELANWNELIRCSWVCRNWRAAYEACKPETLCLAHDNFFPLNHRLLLSKDRLVKINFFKTSNDLKLLESEFARAHFANIKKLILTEIHVNSQTNYQLGCTFSFKNQLNHFRNLEYLEIQSKILTFRDTEIELPKLKTLCLYRCDCDDERVKIVLNTPSLETLGILSIETSIIPENLIAITNFKFLFPNKLKYLEFKLTGKDVFKFSTRFENLECLVLKNYRTIFHQDFSTCLLSDDFLSALPSLKFLFSTFTRNRPDRPNLERQKKKFKLNDLICQDIDGCRERFDYNNWQAYLQYKEQVSFYPEKFKADFSELINCQLPLHHFKEDYLKLVGLNVGNVTDRSGLIELLKSTKLQWLYLNHDFSLENVQDFFDEIAYFLTLEGLSLFEATLNQLTNFAFLEKLNFKSLTLKYEQLPEAFVSIALKKPSCYYFNLQSYSGWYEIDGELKINDVQGAYHSIEKHENSFFCSSCGFASETGPTSSDALVKSIVGHLDEPEFSIDDDFRDLPEGTDYKKWVLNKFSRMFDR